MRGAPRFAGVSSERPGVDRGRAGAVGGDARQGAVFRALDEARLAGAGRAAERLADFDDLRPVADGRSAHALARNRDGGVGGRRINFDFRACRRRRRGWRDGLDRRERDDGDFRRTRRRRAPEKRHGAHRQGRQGETRDPDAERAQPRAERLSHARLAEGFVEFVPQTWLRRARIAARHCSRAQARLGSEKCGRGNPRKFAFAVAFRL